MRFKPLFCVCVVTVVVSGSVGCAEQTHFEGAAKFPGGPRGCYDRCRENGMSMASFVFVGDYSTGCVCEPLRGPYPEKAARFGAESSAAAAAGVALQLRAVEEGQRQSYGAH